MRIDCKQTILMKYHALFVIFEKAAKFESVVCCKLKVVLYGLTGSCCGSQFFLVIEFYKEIARNLP